MRRHLILNLVLLTGLLLLPASASLAADSVLGPNGAIYTLSASTYAEAFPDGDATADDAAVLVLRIERAGEAPQHLLVPGTEGAEIEVSPSIVVEETSNTVYLAWQSWYNAIHSRLFLGGLTSAGWIEPIEVSNRPFAMVSSPRLAVTRDTFTTREDALESVHQRTVLHLVWVDEGAEFKEILYIPVFLLNGQYIPTQVLTNLSAMVPSVENPTTGPSEASLAETLAIKVNAQSHSVTVAFADEASNQMVTLDLQVVPGAVTEVAETMGLYIREQLGNGTAPAGEVLSSIASKARAHLIDIGHRLPPVVRNHMAAEVVSSIMSHGPGVDPETITADARAHLIDIGARFDRPGLNKVDSPKRAHLIDIGVRGDRKDLPTPPRADHHVMARISTQREIPVITDGERPTVRPEILVSTDGAKLLVAWEEETEAGVRVLYRETRNSDGWSDAHVIPLRDDLPRTEVRRLLENRIDD